MWEILSKVVGIVKSHNTIGVNLQVIDVCIVTCCVFGNFVRGPGVAKGRSHHGSLPLLRMPSMEFSSCRTYCYCHLATVWPLKARFPILGPALTVFPSAGRGIPR
jgi:hypothetical protein